ncbi:MAG: ABC transporter ATP-binding protein [Candidatus Cloacimonetes bacterium]|nr:ABC transporter ATP-binding protein [Candidatus Cloacimonadota bacterium]
MKVLRRVLRWLAPLWRLQRKQLLLVLGLTVLAVAIRTLYPLIFKFVLDALVDPGNALSARGWVLALLGAGVLQQTIQWLLPVSRAKANLDLGMAIRMRTLHTVLRKKPAFYTRYRSGDLVTRLTDDVDTEDKLSWYSCSGVMRPVEASLVLIFSLVVMLTLNWKLTLFATLPLPIVVWALSRTEKIQERHYSERQKRTSQTVDVLESAFSGVRIVLSYVAEAAQSRLLDRVLHDRESSEKNVLTLRALLEALGALLNQLGVIVVLFAGGYYLIKGQLSLGDFYAFVTYLSSLTEPLWTLSWFFVSTTLVGSSVDRLSQIEEEPEFTPGSRRPAHTGTLRVHDLAFRWEGGAPLLEGIGLEVGRGEMVALVGPVGCGKSTLLDLAAGLLPAEHGVVTLDHVPVEELETSRRSSWLGYVPQENLLFSGTVGENVSMDREGIDAQRVLDSLSTACVLDEFPPEREIAQGGIGLSGGQRARVAIARALATRPDVLLLDDVTSALDAATEQLFWTRLRQWLPQTGVLVSTHREATARVADRVLWLDRGRIVHSGRHEDLLRAHPEYMELFARDEQPA